MEQQPHAGRRKGRRPRLGLFLNMPVHEVDGEYTARYPHLFDFFLLLASRTESTDLCVPLRRGGERRAEHGRLELPANVRILGLGHWTSGTMLLRRAPLVVPYAAGRFARRVRRWDTVGAVAPGLVGNLLVAVARRAGVPVFVLVRGDKQRTMRLMLRRGAGAYVWALRQAERPVERWVEAGIPIFTAGEEMRARYGRPGGRVHDLYPGLSRAFPLAGRGREPRDDPAVRLVSVTRLSGEKGVDDLVRTVALLRRDGVPATARVLGDGPERDALASLARELGTADAVQLAGFVPHGPRLIAELDAADVFVLLSRSEGMPHSLVEAMARALPVVVSDVGGMPSLVRRRGGGVVVPVGDPEAAARRIAELARDPALRARLSGEALAAARDFRPGAQLDAFCARLDEAYPGRGWRLDDREDVAPPPGQ